MTTKQDLINALQKLQFAMNEVCAAWNEADHTGTLLIDGYPFDKSFEEVTQDVSNWTNKSIQSLK